MNKRLLLILLILSVTGCAKLANLDKLLTLKRYGENVDTQHAFVDAQNESFRLLLEAYKNGKITVNRTKQSILDEFGNPILSKETKYNGQLYEMFLYRPAIQYFHGEKIYLYFNSEDLLKEWEHYIPPPKENEKEV